MTSLVHAWHWAAAHWGTIAIVLAVFITTLNAATAIWHDQPKTTKWLYLIISALAVIRSKGADPGILGAIKFPFVPESRNLSAVEAIKPPATTALFPLFIGIGLALGGQGCATTTAGHQFDPNTALTTACALEPALNTIATVGVCSNLKEPAKTTCLKVAAIVHASAEALLIGATAIYSACRGTIPLAPKKAPLKVVKPASAPTTVPVK